MLSSGGVGDLPEHEADPHSSFRLEVSIAVGYQRRRSLIAGKWEGPLTSISLLVGGILLVLLVVLRVLGWWPF